MKRSFYGWIVTGIGDVIACIMQTCFMFHVWELTDLTRSKISGIAGCCMMEHRLQNDGISIRLQDATEYFQRKRITVLRL